MILFGLIAGIYGLLVFILGLLGWLSQIPLRLLTLVVLILASSILLIKLKHFSFGGLSRFEWFIVGLGGLTAVVNLIGALGPELGFDALWYHLTIPKIYLQAGRIFYIPGGLYYYSAMPKLGEMLYLAGLAFVNNGQMAKLTHFTFGILAAVGVFKLARHYLGRKYSLISATAFYTTLLVGWESTTAYIDLIWVFYLVLTIERLINWVEKEKSNSFVLSAIFLGLAYGTKMVSLVFLGGVLMVIVYYRRNLFLALKYIFVFIFISLPWFIFSQLTTGNPVYPLFSPIMPLKEVNFIPSLNPVILIGQIFKNLTWPQDPFSVFVGSLAIVYLLNLKSKMKKEVKLLLILLIFYYIGWYFFFRESGSRFLLPILPLWLIISLTYLEKEKTMIKKIFIAVFIFSTIFNLGYRFFANRKYLPIVSGKQNRADFLITNLNFSFGDIYDTNSEIKYLVGENTVLVSGFHNLFYLDFNFVHASYADQNQEYRFILSDQAGTTCLKGYRLVYENLKINSLLCELAK